MKKLITSIFILSFTCGLYAQNDRVITTAVPFLLIPTDARSAGMGDMGVATSPDAFSQNWNAAKNVFAEKQIGIGLSYTPYLSDLVSDIFLGSVNYYNRINERSAWAASFKYFSLGDIEFNTFDGFNVIPQGTESPNEFALDVSYALRLSDQFSMAVGGRFIRSDLKLAPVDPDATAASSFAVDITGYYQSEEKAYDSFNGRWRGGFAITNLGPKLKYDQGGNEFFLPTKLGLGGGFDFIFDEYNKLGVTIETTKLLVPTPSIPVDGQGNEVSGEDDPNFVGYQQSDEGFLSGVFSSFGDAPDGFGEELKEFTWSLGAEYTYQDSFAMRAGYFNESEEKGARKFFTIGAGFTYNVMKLDVSYLFSASKVRNPLENTLRFSLTFNLGGEYQEY
ncbi:type IX secretion system outer membrane channel protein PorV [Sungkyunkwania multivorans]|uniref:Type IX secretion system outer membrane channel protein PorV n=1 Tax=Sungkyunkwania multivorans TaxID=1173618 RepID=A0ABW3D1Z0_9FLAO